MKPLPARRLSRVKASWWVSSLVCAVPEIRLAGVPPHSRPHSAGSRADFAGSENGPGEALSQANAVDAMGGEELLAENDCTSIPLE